MKNLNNTNLNGKNFYYKARIQFSYKSKVGDQLQLTDCNSFRRNELQNKNSHCDKILFDESKSKDKSLYLPKTQLKRGFRSDKSSDKMQIDDKNPPDKDKSSISKDEKINDDKYLYTRLKDQRENHLYLNKGNKYVYKDEKKERNQDYNDREFQKPNICYMCKIPGHLARDCILTKDFCFECGLKGHFAKECRANMRKAKILTEHRVKGILSQQMPYIFIKPGDKIRNIVNYYKNLQN